MSFLSQRWLIHGWLRSLLSADCGIGYYVLDNACARTSVFVSLSITSLSNAGPSSQLLAVVLQSARSRRLAALNTLVPV